MAQPNGLNPVLEGLNMKTQNIVAAAADLSTTNNKIFPGVTSVKVTGVTTNADDWIRLPSLASVQDGHEITLLCSAGSNFELRTPSASAEEINSEDCDSTKEYLCTDTQIVKIVKINDTIGWMAHAYTAIGAVATAVVPD